MQGITCREMRPQDVSSWLAVHSTHFPPLTEEAGFRWAAREDVTAILALRGSEPVGAVPFHLRDFRVNPQAAVGAGFEHAVLVKESLRDQGIGSRMMDVAKEILLGRCDAMMVYRGAERSAGYRFYARNGHHDLAYLRPFVLDQPRLQPTTKAERSGRELLLEREGEFLAVFDSAYGRYGGFPSRRPGYYKDAFSSAYFDMIPHEFVLIRVEEQGALQGYALISRELAHGRAQLLELATRGGDSTAAHAVLQEAVTLASEWGVGLRTFATDCSPYARTLLGLGFRPVPRSESSMMIMGYVLDPASLASKVWQENEEAEGLEVEVWTPLREAVIHRPSGRATGRVTLEMKEDSLTRLLLSRLDLMAAVRQDLVTVVGGNDREVDAISRALPLAPWAYHHLDYI
ncbi:MAG: GNAT family N-acetyltransferase [Anaerolineae bacterium]|nr:GNAT family N-acetyltransferase [Anaerolineae bacterium]